MAAILHTLLLMLAGGSVSVVFGMIGLLIELNRICAWHWSP